MAEFPELGVQCSLDVCKKLDYMPFLCTLCKSFYCSDHRFEHKCKPNEKQLRTVTKGENGKFKQFLCAKSGCFEMEWSKIECSLCKSNFCMSHRNCEDHDCTALVKGPSKQTDTPAIITPEIIIKAPKKNIDPVQQARADKVAAMRLKAKNAFNIPISEVLIIFVTIQSADRFPCMISKVWTVNRCKTSLADQCGLKSVDTSTLGLYVEDKILNLDDTIGKCLTDMQDVNLLPIA